MKTFSYSCKKCKSDLFEENSFKIFKAKITNESCFAFVNKIEEDLSYYGL